MPTWTGHIGYQATERFPSVRQANGSLPSSAATTRMKWKGFVPFDEMPRVYDPESGVLGSAKRPHAPDGYKYSPEHEWESALAYRSASIACWSPERNSAPGDMLALQMDIFSSTL